MNARELADRTRSVEPNLLVRTVQAVRARVAGALPVLGVVIGLWLLTRFGFLLVTYLAGVFQLAPGPVPFQPTGYSGAILGWQRWDVNHYMIISRFGYREPGATNFFPLYPLTVGAVS